MAYRYEVTVRGNIDFRVKFGFRIFFNDRNLNILAI